MVQAIRVIYEDGLLRPLDPIDLHEGQTVNITILTEAVRGEATTAQVIDARLRAAGLLAEIEPVPEDIEELSAEERERIGSLFKANRPLEDIIDEERGSY